VGPPKLLTRKKAAVVYCVMCVDDTIEKSGFEDAIG